LVGENARAGQVPSRLSRRASDASAACERHRPSSSWLCGAAEDAPGKGPASSGWSMQGDLARACPSCVRETVRVQPDTRFARSGDVSIAYQVLGDGPLDVVWIPSMTHHVELVWESPAHARFLRRLASISRLICFDKRGTGMSDHPAGPETLEARMDDIRA